MDPYLSSRKISLIRQKLPPLIGGIIAVNCLVFILQIFYPSDMISLFALVPDAVFRNLYIWQLVTYMFLHGGILHLFVNMVALYLFGSELLYQWKHRKFLIYYFFTGIGAGLCSLVSTNVPTIGASGAIFGILLAYAITFPNKLVYLYFLFPIRAKYFVILFGAVELLATIEARQDGIAHIAHLGGMFFGIIYLLLDKLVDNHRKKRFFSSFRTRRHEWWETPYDKEEIDRILDKILSDGIDKLTQVERRKLIMAGKIIAQHKKRANENNT